MVEERKQNQPTGQHRLWKFRVQTPIYLDHFEYCQADREQPSSTELRLLSLLELSFYCYKNTFWFRKRVRITSIFSKLSGF